jgi:TonB family protein
MPKPRITAAEPSMDVDLPTVAAVRLDHPAIPRRSETPVQVRLENSRPSAVRRVVGAIPMLGFLKKTKSLPENYTPPKVVKEIRPKAPVGLAEEVPVRVRVLLNSDGGIDRTELLTRKVDSSVAEAALDAAKRWRFEPARVAAKPVASEIVVQFNFPPSSGG